jgi:hypothetical protein
MRTLLGVMTLLVVFSGPPSASGQGFFGLTPPRPGDLPVAPGRGISADKRASSLSYSSLVPAKVRGYLVNPYGTYSISRVTYVYVAPSVIAATPSVAMIPPAGQNPDEDRQVERVPPPRRAEAEAPLVPEALAPGAPASVFRPIRPEDRARAGVATMPAPGRTEVPATPSVPPFREPPPLAEPPTAADPKTARAQQIASGKEALRAHQYSRAERNFLRATEKFPEDLPAYFLLAQARFALGKYAEAVAAIHAGMRLHPDWPNAPFHPRELYEVKATDFPEQLKRLVDALAEYPDDPFLTFLYAHQLWFDNRKDDAR